MKGICMGITVKDYQSERDLKIQNKTIQNKNSMSDAEKQELSEYLKKFGIDLP